MYNDFIILQMLMLSIETKIEIYKLALTTNQHQNRITIF